METDQNNLRAGTAVKAVARLMSNSSDFLFHVPKTIQTAFFCYQFAADNQLQINRNCLCY